MAPRFDVRSLLPKHVAHLRRIREIRREADDDDVEALARMFTDEAICDDGTARGRLEVILEATEHRWVLGLHTPLDVPGLYEIEGYSDAGFRPELRDPWSVSGDQVGHLLTAVALALKPDLVTERRFGWRVRDLVGAPESMANDEVALRFAIGHEKLPDPGRFDPLMLLKVRRQFASATGQDVRAFRLALDALGPSVKLELGPAIDVLQRIDVGAKTGNSIQDLTLTLVGYRLSDLIRCGKLASGSDVAGWVRLNLHE